MTNNNDDDTNEAGSFEFLITGCCGIIIFSYCFILASFGYFSAKSPSSEIFFIGIAIMSICELPRYFTFAIEQEFTSRVAYSFHILGGAFFFVSLCTVCNMWSSILRLGPIASAIYSQEGLITAACLLGSVEIIAFGFCIAAKSLHTFFSTRIYVAFVVEEILQSLIYSTGLFMFGIKLIVRLDNYASMSTNLKQLKSVVYRLTGTLGVTSIASFLRLGMCILQLYSLDGHEYVWRENFPQFGFLWFLFAEFIPRGMSSVALMHLMRNTNDARKREKLTTGRYVLSSSLTSMKKTDYSLRQPSSSAPSIDEENRQTLGDSLMNYHLSSESEVPSLLFNFNDRMASKSSSVTNLH